MFSEKNIVRFIAFSPLFFIPTVIVIFSYIFLQINSNNYHKSLDELQIRLKKDKSLALKSKVDSIVKFIEHKKSVTTKQLKERVENRVQNAHKVAVSIYEKYKDTKTQAEIKEIIVAALRAFYWNNGDSFIWIIDYDGVFQLAAGYLRHLEGKSILWFQDATGRYVIKEEIDICKKQGSGFLWDTFTKPNGKKGQHYKQLAFVKDFGFYDWYLGSSEQLTTASEITNKLLIDAINSLKNIDNNYIFIIEDDGKFLVHENESFLGKYLKDINQEIYKKINIAFKASDKSEIEYDWHNEKIGLMDKKYTYISKVPNTNWIVGSGYYATDFLKDVTTGNKKLKQEYDDKLKYIILVGLFMTILALIVSYIVSKQVKIIYTGYRKNLHDNEIHMKELEVLANTDSLTQLKNRHAIIEDLEREIARYKRHKEPFSLAMFDIDYFKKVNDTYGHDVGDDVLKTISKIVSENLRELDSVGRYGGEEFLIIMPSTTIDIAKEVILRLHKKIETYKFDKVGQVTISMGLIEMRDGEEFDHMFKRVDDFLYHAKDTGRNKVSFEREL